MTLRRCAVIALSIGVIALCGCADKPRSEAAAPSVPQSAPPETYEDIAERLNARAERLDRLWARAVVAIKYRDADNRRRTEQGEGHFQFLAPSQLALSVGKLGEIIAWLGCDSTRFWFFERGDADRLTVSRHENVGRPCSRPGAVPCNPLDIIDLLGVTPIPAKGGRVAWAADGRRIVVEIPARTGRRLITLEPGSSEPARIVLMPPTGPTPLLVAELTDYTNVAITGSGAISPRAPGRAVITLPETGEEIRIAFYDASDGTVAGRLNPDAFDVDFLVDAFQPKSIYVLDAACENPAMTPRSAPDASEPAAP